MMPGITAPAQPPAATLTQVYSDIFITSCSVCHGMAPNAGLNGGLGMITSKDAFYTAVVGKAATSMVCTGRGTLIVPFQPVQSLLFQVLTSTPPCGMRMPLGMAPLTDAQMAIFEGWIMAGAKND